MEKKNLRLTNLNPPIHRHTALKWSGLRAQWQVLISFCQIFVQSGQGIELAALIPLL